MPKWLGTFWLGYVRKEDKDLVDGKFYGSGIYLGGIGDWIIAQSIQVKEFIVTPDRDSLYWVRPMQLVFDTGRDNYVIHHWGVSAEFANKKRNFWLSLAFGAGQINSGMSLLARRPKEVGAPLEGLPQAPFPDKKWWEEDLSEFGDCEFWGWSIEHEDGPRPRPPGANSLRHFVSFPVEKQGVCSITDSYCRFKKSDGKWGGFCNNFMDAGSPIMCGEPGKPKVLYFITTVNKFYNTVDTGCSTNISAFRVTNLGWTNMRSLPSGPERRLVDEPECDESSE